MTSRLNTLNKSFRELFFKNPIYLLVLLIFMIITAVNLFYHEMWRDELHIWLMAKYSSSLTELFFNKRYDGHPDLWYLLVYLVKHLWDSPYTMQVLHYLISLATATVFLFYSPLKTIEKILLIFGYYFMYEYATISRFYSLGNLELFIFCTLYVNKSKYRNFLLSIVLFFLFQTNVYSWLIAALLGSLFIRDYYFSTEIKTSKQRVEFYICLGIIFIGAIFSFQRSLPPVDTGIAFGWKTTFDIDLVKQIIAGYWSGFFPIPKFDFHFWNQNIIKTEIMRAWFGLALLLITSSFFWRKKKFFYLFIAGEIGMMIFMYIKYPGCQRHQGQLFFYFLAILWIYKLEEIKQGYFRWLKPTEMKTIFLLLIFLSHFTGGIIASFYDWKSEFSSGKVTAEFIKEKHLEKTIIAGSWDYSLTSVSGYLNRPLFFLNGGKEGSYVLFNLQRLENNTYHYIKNAWSKSEYEKKKYLFIFNFPQDTLSLQLSKLWESPDAINGDEKYYLYTLKPNFPRLNRLYINQKLVCKKY